MYEEKGLDYPSICNPQWSEVVASSLTRRIHSDPSLFYGFWGACFNDYRKTTPHEGYTIIKNWRDMLFSQNEEFQQIFEGKSMR